MSEMLVRSPLGKTSYFNVKFGERY